MYKINQEDRFSGIMHALDGICNADSIGQEDLAKTLKILEEELKTPSVPQDMNAEYRCAIKEFRLKQAMQIEDLQKNNN